MKTPDQIGLIFFFSEVALRFRRSAGKNSQRVDRGSLAVLWVSITLAVAGAVWCTRAFPAAAFSLSPAAIRIAVAMFALGLALRWWAILVLGKFFTVEVAIADDHRLVIRGPYRFVRHPSYTGFLVAFAALAVTLQNWISVAVVMIPVAIALTYRIGVEERALIGAFGDDYRAYARSTKRLIPGIY